MRTHWYCFVRTDIPLEDQACQIAHACAGAGKRFLIDDNCNLVLLGVKDQKQLLEAVAVATNNQIRKYLNHEPDDDMGYTAFATEAIEQYQRLCFRPYRIWKGCTKLQIEQLKAGAA